MSENDDDTFIPAMNIKRLIGDVKNIIKNPLTQHGIYYSHDENDILKGYALIIGPKECVYDSGAYLFEFFYPTTYPFSPPVVKYKTNNGYTRFNPNLYKNGKVCISLLNTWRGDQWSSCQNISTILLNLVSLLNNTPLLNEPGITESNQDFPKYNKIIQYENINFAILKFLNKDYFINGFENFYEIYKKYMQENYYRIKKKLEELQKEKKEEVTVQIYRMRCNINYYELLEKYKSVEDNILKT